MEFDVYCDENHPELFTSSKPQARYLMIGSLWLPMNLREDIKTKIWALREQYQTWGEIKWSKVSRSRIGFYKALIDLFCDYGDQLRFRCIAVDHRDFDHIHHQGDKELGFYKFYYQVLHHWILDFNTYRIFCDLKQNRDKYRLKTLKECLSNANLLASIETVQALPSKQLTLIQFADFLLGMTSAKLNETLVSGSIKAELVDYFEVVADRQIKPTYRAEKKYNIFKINLKGGW